MNRSLIKKIFLIVIIAAAGLFVYFNLSAFMPILLALLTAMVFEPFVKFLQRKMKQEKRLLPVTIVFLGFLFVSGVLLYITVRYLIESIYGWTLQLPQYAFEIQQFADKLISDFTDTLDRIPQGAAIVAELQRLSETAVDAVLGFTATVITTIAAWLQSIPNLLFVTLVYIITLFLFSLDLPRLLSNTFNLFKDETSQKLQFVFRRMGKVFLGYWKAQFILSIGVFLACYISLLFIAPSSALIMSILIWVVDIIPLYVGPALILVPWGLVAIILGNTAMGIQLMVLALVLLILRRIIEPKVLGDSIGLNALPTVLSMYFGFVFFGVMGLILGPFVYIAVRSAIEAGLFRLNAQEETPAK
ncbi:sporulation integral membrane protein YtvI [Shouchella clausii]|uniref:Sporulation integral membrane protein YtvI n=1 Tax=Shouchella clausii TaxID=79880 RepID=A0A268RYF4_SHOCL|nr:sporulation integral membrane protein YtvI [Shouchella clausii]PAD44782.1 sporulation integral membrane protein YtvI [Bacillus sp. 7520-S]MBU8596432.1 sporulation integral membrane protein YtvI [Shouchella clausii]MCY1103774.1 sporulation integral membrane protein YtvI [Shouchella clausii]MEB5481143.1 sporulation integral membrane protein YtvI [Shouchella clausii]MED4158371.1 sporulation integral membrane protein YtvI [Shouchella clausii]